ncbi:MAG: VCBS repeat-containing protein [Candidatus Accumulibacter sp.]|jgi:hypothetical protein|nr:VCBS repeat-containing protein [Accumulibacter sp.]
MKIADSALQLESSHSQLQQHEVSESMRMWIGDRRPDFGDGGAVAAPADSVSISDAGRAAQAADGTALSQAIEAAGQDPVYLMIRHLLARLTGKEVDVFDASSLGNAPTPGSATPAAASRAGFGVEYDRHESYTEAEQTSFTASGVVRTADGKSIGFKLSLSMSRSYHMESDVSIRLGDAAPQTTDPLVINFSGNAAQLTSQRFFFDLNADGKASEQINFLAGGSGFLSFDRNGDGEINDGFELFGARTGNGFAELAALDDDDNGWIDENDAAYAQLSVWIRDSAGGNTLYSLKDANVGAISLASVSSPFAVKDGNNKLLGQIRASGVYLRENGGAGSIQQIDLTV